MPTPTPLPDLQDPHATPQVLALQLTMARSVYARLEAAAERAGCSIAAFVLSAADDQAERLLLLDDLARQRAERTGHSGRPARRATPRLLSRREFEVLTLLAAGHTAAETAQALQLSGFTVGDHIKAIYRKLGVSSRAEAVLLAARIGLITHPEV